MVDYGVGPIPESYLVDPSGTVVAKYDGGVTVASQLNADHRQAGRSAPRDPGFWRWAPWLALGVVAVVGPGRRGPPQQPSRPSTAETTAHLASEVRCPVCQGETAAQSNTPASIQIRDQIRQELAAGEPPGPSILSGIGRRRTARASSRNRRPSGVGLVVWVVPVIAVVLAVAGLALAFARWRPGREASVSDEDRPGGPGSATAG